MVLWGQTYYSRRGHPVWFCVSILFTHVSRISIPCFLLLQSTSEWTLDYPPFFALFEWVLSIPAQWFDPNMLTVTAAPYQSTLTVVYQRLTVIITDLLLFYAIRQFIRTKEERMYQSYASKQRQLTLVSSKAKGATTLNTNRERCSLMTTSAIRGVLIFIVCTLHL